MEERHEIIQFDSNSPIKVFMHKLGSVSRHWHESMELLFVLAGRVSVLCGNAQVTLEKGDIFLINSNAAHELNAEECVLIAVQIKLSKFSLPAGEIQDLYFDCNSADGGDFQRYHRLKSLIAAILYSSASANDSTLYSYRAFAYSLLAELVRNFRVEKPAREINSRKHMERLADIVHYIGEHYQEQLTLVQVAKYAHLSVPYFSTFFEKYMGLNFTSYYTDLRLEHAMRELLLTDSSIETIASACGFADQRAFVRAFKKKYSMVPSAYRKENSSPVAPDPKDPLLAINYLEFKPESYLHVLSQYLPESSEQTAPNRGPRVSRGIDAVDVSTSQRILTHNWRTMIGVGRAKELTFAPVQRMLSQLQRDVGFKYVRFHGILSDDMLVCLRDRNGALNYSFVFVDQVLDFLLSIGLKPALELSFMPAAIAETPERTVFAAPMTVSFPTEPEAWESLVRQFMEHALRRYGRDEVRSWMVTLWNEPETSETMFGFRDEERFFELYCRTYRCVKALEPEISFGAPSIYPTQQASLDWLERYLRYARENDCVPDYLDIHYYSDDFADLEGSSATFFCPCALRDDPEEFGKYLDRVFACMERIGAGDLPIHISEWNLTVSHRNLINDTCFKGCYLVKNLLENYDRTASFTYWMLTDLIEENQPDPKTFHGGMGLFTQDGIKKPPFFAMEMLRRLGDRLVAAGDGYFITAQGQRLQIILYNYEHFNSLFAQGGFGLSDTSRDSIFQNRTVLEFTVPLTGLAPGSWRIKERILNQQHGSCYDSWVAMGAPDLGPEEARWLAQTARPDLKLRTEDASPQGELTLTVELQPHEVRLIEISPADCGLY